MAEERKPIRLKMEELSDSIQDKNADWIKKRNLKKPKKRS